MKTDPVPRCRRTRRTVLVLLTLSCLAAGCSIKPWVKPYERERLVDPLMREQGEPLSARHFERVRNEREGARGAGGIPGGGCGCN